MSCGVQEVQLMLGSLRLRLVESEYSEAEQVTTGH